MGGCTSSKPEPEVQKMLTPQEMAAMSTALKDLEKFKFGDRVTVKGYDRCAGTVRFVGLHHIDGNKRDGSPRVGVELDKPIGLDAGTVHGIRYFTCAPNHGVLVRPGHVSPLKTKPKLSKAQIELRILKKFSHGQRVIVRGYDGHGTIRFLGFHHMDGNDRDGTARIGVELDAPIGHNDGEVNAVRYFSSEPKCGVLVQPSHVKPIKAEKFAAAPTIVNLADDGSGVTNAAMRELARFNYGDRVKVKGYDAGGNVRFIGLHHVDHNKRDGSPRIGVVLSKPVGNNDGTVNGTRYFRAESNRGVLVQPSHVRHMNTDIAMLEDFKFGDRVKVHGYDGSVGTIRFLGFHHNDGNKRDGTPRIGVELDDPVGNNDGIVMGFRYFTCQAKRGVLVRPKKVIYYEGTMDPPQAPDGQPIVPADAPIPKPGTLSADQLIELQTAKDDGMDPDDYDMLLLELEQDNAISRRKARKKAKELADAQDGDWEEYALADASAEAEVDGIENAAAASAPDNGTGGGDGGATMDAMLPDHIVNSLVAHSHV